VVAHQKKLITKFLHISSIYIDVLKMAQRLQHELKLLKANNDPYAGYLIEVVGDNLHHWRCGFSGPSDSPFEGGAFILDIKFAPNHPFTPPTVTFETPVYHPNVDSTGNICLDILTNQWSAVLTICKLISSIASLLHEANPDDPLSPEIAHLYKNNRAEYNKRVRAHVKKHAQATCTKPGSDKAV
jgi:ubiquitin-conjugating enzyme E2 D